MHNFGAFDCALCDFNVFLARMHSRGGLCELEEGLHDDPFEKLREARLIPSQLRDLAACNLEEILKVLLAAVEQLQTRFVRERRLCAGGGVRVLVRGRRWPDTYIFCAVSAPLRFFSYCASMACCSCFTSFAWTYR
jgi:hypothetical protein